MSCSYRCLCHICPHKRLFLPLVMCFSSVQKAESSLNMFGLGSCSHSTYIELGLSVLPSVMAEAVTVLSNISAEPESFAEFPVSVFY